MKSHLTRSTGERAAKSSINSTRSHSESRSSRPGEPPSRSWARGVARSVHCTGTAKLPRSTSRRISVSTPATRRCLSTLKRRPRRGWKGCSISAHPEALLGECAVRTDRADRGGQVDPAGATAGAAAAHRPDVQRAQPRLPAGAQRAWRGVAGAAVRAGRLPDRGGCGFGEILGLVCNTVWRVTPRRLVASCITT